MTTIVIELRPTGSGNSVTASGIPKGVDVEVRDYGRSLAGLEVESSKGGRAGTYTSVRFDGGAES